jgi:two-component system LytT family response regulator
MIKAIIIDDEQHCVDRLSNLLVACCADSVELVGTAQSVEEGIDSARRLHPDLLFLDVQLRDRTAFEMLEQLTGTPLNVIFTTAFEKYAVQAFRFSAIDYLLKPVAAEDLLMAVARLREKMSKEDMARKLDVLFHNMKGLSGSSKKIAVPTTTGLEFLDVNNIVRCKAEENYTVLFLREGKQKMTVARTLKEFEELLGDYNFFRVHHSHLINLSHIKRYHKGKGGHVAMADNSEIEVSTRRKEEFLKRLATL